MLLTGCAKDPLVQRESFVFGTRVEILIWGASTDKANEAASAVLQEFDRLHREFHAWQPSQLTALNDDIAAGKPHKVSPELAQLIIDAQNESKRGDYLFDPGIGAEVKLWGFHDDTFKPQLPDAEALEALKSAHPSISDLVMDGLCPGLGKSSDVAAGCQVLSLNRAVALDFGGYLKGVALDHAAAILRANGVKNALVNIGGNIIALGKKGDQPWRVGIQHPRNTGPLASLELRDGEAIGTSGDYQRYFEFNGRRYCHLIDPRLAMPADGTQSLTILIPAGQVKPGMRSDADSKPLFVAGKEWPAMAKKTGLAHILRVDNLGKVEITPEMKSRITFETADLHATLRPAQ
ncbi:MAG: FAD:protein FMN transferase [Verrucomicrobia bacterium]|nr:MAG: FAD:protein FMN transferase [Verrucomicrobiota bacterium]